MSTTRKRYGRLAPAALLASLVATAAGCGSDAPPAASVVLVTVDTLRADHVFGEAAGAGDGFARLRRDGTWFENAFSTSSATAPSHASILTGLYPSFHSIGLLNGHYPLTEETVTLAERLRAAGFATGAVVSNPVLARSLGLAAGFDGYDDHFEGREKVRDSPERYADRAVDLAIEWLDRHPQRSFFLWLHLQEPHGPYVPPQLDDCASPALPADLELPFGSDNSGYRAIPAYQRLATRSANDYRRRYACEVAETARQLDRFLDRLAADPRFADTLVALTADHGEAMGEDAFWFGHSHSVGLDQVRVPLAIAGPGAPAGATVAAPVSNAWLAATVLAALDLEVPGDLEGRSLLALARGEAAAHPVFVESLSQSGVAFGNGFLRRDRWPASADRIWQRVNPNTGGRWVPLGRQVAVLGRATGEVSVVHLERLLDRFDRRARAARSGFSAERKATERSDEEKAAIRSLGYVR